MNLRTIVGWAIYDPKRKVIVTMKPLKRLAKPSKYPGCVLVKMKGHYFRRTPSTHTNKEKS